jgi:hypothetical protein
MKSLTTIIVLTIALYLIISDVSESESLPYGHKPIHTLDEIVDGTRDGKIFILKMSIRNCDIESV